MTVGEMIGLNMEPEDEAVTWERIRTSGLRRRMECLARNLRDAGALCEAHLLGHTRGVFRPLKTDDESIKAHYRETTWRPNCEGAEAPGYGLVWNIKA